MNAQLPDPDEVFQGRYRLESVLGEGGFARVFVATDVELSRKVAIKILKPRGDGTDDVQAARFEREARHVAQLSHPHIVTMFDYGRTESGLLYTVFELVGGTDLAKMMTLGPVEERTAVVIMLQLLDALSAAHEVGLLHRDIKPANIQVYAYGGDPHRVKLLDFGIAKITDGDAALTATGMVVGTPRFIAPEAVFGEPLGPFSDLYALALVVYEMLVGAPSDHLRKVANHERVELPADLSVSPKLRRVLNRMLERKVSDRYADARSVANDLNSTASAPVARPVVRPSSAEPGPQPQPHDVAARGNGRMALIAAGGLIAGALVVVGVLQASKQQPPETAARAAVPPGAVSPAASAEPFEIVVERLDTGSIHVDAAVLAPGCGGEAFAPGIRGVSRMDGLRERTWIQHTPVGYDPAVQHPLVIFLHDDGGATARSSLAETRLAETADKYGFVIVAPQDDAIAYVWSNPRDIDTIEFVHDATRKSTCIDEDRVFMVGYGSGGWGVEGASCLPWVKGGVIVSFMLEQPRFNCQPQRGVPMLVILPTHSGYLPPGGGPDCLNNSKVSFDGFDEMWRTRNGCGSAATAFATQGASGCTAWDCESRYASCRIDGGRRWPGAPERQIDLVRCDGPSTDFPYNETLWKFLSDTP